MATQHKNFWLMKSEPSECSIDDALAAKNATVPWTGAGIAGLAEVASSPYPDATQFDRKSKYYDAAAKREEPRWVLVDVRALKKTRLVGIAELRAHPELADMVILRRGNRLSITPVTAAEWRFITTKLLKATA